MGWPRGRLSKPAGATPYLSRRVECDRAVPPRLQHLRSEPLCGGRGVTPRTGILIAHVGLVVRVVVLFVAVVRASVSLLQRFYARLVRRGLLIVRGDLFPRPFLAIPAVKLTVI